MTKKNELVATAHLKKKKRIKKEILAVPVQKDRNKACRKKEKSDRDKGINADRERKEVFFLSETVRKIKENENIRFKILILER